MRFYNFYGSDFHNLEHVGVRPEDYAPCAYTLDQWLIQGIMANSLHFDLMVGTRTRYNLTSCYKLVVVSRALR